MAAILLAVRHGAEGQRSSREEGTPNATEALISTWEKEDLEREKAEIEHGFRPTHYSQNTETPWKKRIRDVPEAGVKTSIYAKWLKDEIRKDEELGELPCTLIVLIMFALFAIFYMDQGTTAIVEDAINIDIEENANFAFAHHFGHKGIVDVNSFADFWSWTRLGFVPLMASYDSWPYSEDLQQAVPRFNETSPEYDTEILPDRYQLPGFRTAVPARNDYLRYNRIIGGFRFRQLVAEATAEKCTSPGYLSIASTFKDWFGKSCTGLTVEELRPDLADSESFEGGERVQFFLSEYEDSRTLIQRTLDMEDGCTSAAQQNRTCLCEWCRESRNPWLNELTKRVEISFIIYNAHYGMYTMANVNFYFNRAGHIHKLITGRSSWAGLMVRDTGTIAVILISGFIWWVQVLRVFLGEVGEIWATARRYRNQPTRKASNPCSAIITIVKDYMGFWNGVDWISIVVTFIIIGFFLTLQFRIALVNDELGAMVRQSIAFGRIDKLEFAGHVQDFYDVTEQMLDIERLFRTFLILYPLVLMLRLFKSFGAQPRLAIVNNTFVQATDDIFHFGIVFFSVYICMTVNAVLLFGQDSMAFSTLDRAIFSCYRTMLGDWDWEGMAEIGLLKAFLWFFLFMLVVVLVLLNIVLAIVMEAYGIASGSAQGKHSLMTEVETIIRRSRQTRRGERVRLGDIYDALLKNASGDEDVLLADQRPLKANDVMAICPEIKENQATRTLKNSYSAWLHENEPLFDIDDLHDGVADVLRRVDYSVMCASYLSSTLGEQVEAIQEEQDRSPAFTSFAAEGGDEQSYSGAASSQARIASKMEEAENLMRSVKYLVKERTDSLAEGVGSVLGEEMQGLERRQKVMQTSMEHMKDTQKNLRAAIYKLTHTCEEFDERVNKFNLSQGG